MSIKSITIHSQNIRYMAPASDFEEVDQELTIYADGAVTLRAKDYRHYYRFSADEEEIFTREAEAEIPARKASFLLELLDRIEKKRFVTDCGRFTMTIRYEEGPERRIVGAMLEDVNALSYGGAPVPMTPLLQRYIPIPGLLGFTGDTTTDYGGRRALRGFALHWARQLLEEGLGGGAFYSDFSADCVAMGFRLDASEGFDEAFPGLIGTPLPDFIRGLGDVTDPDLLGSLALSASSRMSHSAEGEESDQVVRGWFAAVLMRIAELAE